MTAQFAPKKPQPLLQLQTLQHHLIHLAIQAHQAVQILQAVLIKLLQGINRLTRPTPKLKQNKTLVAHGQILEPLSHHKLRTQSQIGMM
jgi:hypothetical protein